MDKDTATLSEERLIGGQIWYPSNGGSERTIIECNRRTGAPMVHFVEGGGEYWAAEDFFQQWIIASGASLTSRGRFYSPRGRL
jgi:hypothetical protein